MIWNVLWCSSRPDKVIEHFDEKVPSRIWRRDKSYHTPSTEYISRAFQNSSVRKICVRNIWKKVIQRSILFLMLSFRNLLYVKGHCPTELLCYIFNFQLKYSRRTQGIDRVEGRFSADGLAKRYALYKYFRVGNENICSARRKSWNLRILRVRYSQQRETFLSKLRWCAAEVSVPQISPRPTSLSSGIAHVQLLRLKQLILKA